MNRTQRAYYATRTPFCPIKGETYQNEGGGFFVCINENGTNPTMENIRSGWKFTANGTGIYEDGKIDWDYSTGGHFAEMEHEG